MDAGGCCDTDPLFGYSKALSEYELGTTGTSARMMVTRFTRKYVKKVRERRKLLLDDLGGNSNCPMIKDY